jgi:hypothetical protein
MPMSFPDFQSLKRRAQQRNFRQPHEGETEEQFREEFANFMVTVDSVESSEIRTGRGWDNQSPQELLINHLGGGRDGAQKLASLMSSLRAYRYTASDGDSFSFDWRNPSIGELLLECRELLDLSLIQHSAPTDKENFAKVFKRAKSLKSQIDNLVLDLTVIDTFLEYGLDGD